MVDKSRFKNSMGMFLLTALFFETNTENKDQVIYTLKDDDHTVNGITYPSLYRLYIEDEDPTEYIFANNHLASHSHWSRLCECSWFQEYVDRWRLELDLKIRARALQAIKRTAKATDSRDAFAANRYLLEKGWAPTAKPGHSRGRPSKEEVQKAIKDEADRLTQMDQDLQRIKADNSIRLVN